MTVARSAPLATPLLTADELAAIRREYRGASLADERVHAFDQMVGDRDVGATDWSKRIVREAYDRPIPKVGRGITSDPGDEPSTDGVVKDRGAARAKATARG